MRGSFLTLNFMSSEVIREYSLWKLYSWWISQGASMDSGSSFSTVELLLAEYTQSDISHLAKFTSQLCSLETWIKMFLTLKVASSAQLSHGPEDSQHQRVGEHSAVRTWRHEDTNLRDLNWCSPVNILWCWVYLFQAQKYCGDCTWDASCIDTCARGAIVLPHLKNPRQKGKKVVILIVTNGSVTPCLHTFWKSWV